jgi:hypothetical protein
MTDGISKSVDVVGLPTGVVRARKGTAFHSNR